MTIDDLSLALTPPPADSTMTGVDLGFFYSAAFLVNTINHVLEIPLLVDKDSTDLVRPLIESDSTLQDVPVISELVLDLIYYLNIGDHRHAISSFIRLFVLVENFEGEQSIHDFLEEYGFFIADLVDADTPDEIESLLNGVADPPGSSRLKRNKNLTVGLNAYLGATYGREYWTSKSPSFTDQFFSPAPTMPIGVALSGLLGRSSAHPQSFSVFLSFLDLGSILSYRGDPAAFGDNKITFKNMFKPGVQMHWNLQDTPFYLGLGAQTGPVYREINGDEFSLRSTRVFLSFGVDVPIKTFYVK